MNNLKLCPVCNKLSRVRKQSVRVKGKLYRYLIYVHDDGSQHRTPELSESPKISLVTLAEEIIEEYIKEPMKFSEIKSLIEEKTKMNIHNQIISRALRNLIKINRLNREVIGRNTIYKINKIVSIKITSEFSQIVIFDSIIKFLIIMKNDSRFIIDKFGILIPFSVDAIKEIDISDSISKIKDIEKLYSTSTDTLYELTLNRFLKQNEYEVITLEIKLIHNLSNFAFRIPFDINQLQIIVLGDNKIVAKLFEKDLLHFTPPTIIRKNINDKIGVYSTIIFGKILENATLSLEILDF